MGLRRRSCGKMIGRGKEIVIGRKRDLDKRD
jgi:hypothetical protein